MGFNPQTLRELHLRTHSRLRNPSSEVRLTRDLGRDKHPRLVIPEVRLSGGSDYGARTVAHHPGTQGNGLVSDQGTTLQVGSVESMLAP